MGVAEGRQEWGHRWLTETRRRSVAIDYVYVRLIGRLPDSSYRIILKIRLVDYTLRSRNLASFRDQRGAKTAAPSNWARSASRFSTSPSSYVPSTCGVRSAP